MENPEKQIEIEQGSKNPEENQLKDIPVEDDDDDFSLCPFFDELCRIVTSIY